MKLTCSKSDLISSLSIVAKAVDAKPQTPLLSGIYLKATGSTLELQTNNYEIGLIARVSATIASEGTIVIPGRYFQEVIRRMPEDDITILLNDEEMTVSIISGTATFKLRSINAVDYPTVNPIEGQLSFTIDSKKLKNLIKKTVFSCSHDEQRPVFTGCLLAVNQRDVSLVGTNTHRLSIKKETFDEEIGEIKIIIPARILDEVMHDVSDVPEDVVISCNHNNISFSFGNLFMVSRLISGQFPNVAEALPKNYASEVVLDTAAFSSAVDRVSLISRSTNYNIIKFIFEGNSLTIASDSPDIGKAEEIISAAIEGPGLKIAFNAQYIIDVLKNIDTDTCRVSLGGSSLAPVCIREAEDDTFLYIATPVRTQF